jgi:two-component system, OmpR family, sensor kinase
MRAGRGIYLLLVEKRSLIQFVSMYVVSTMLFLVTLSIVYYQYQKNILLETKRSSMQIYAEKVIDSIYDAKTKTEVEKYYAEDKRYDMSLHDEKKKPIFSTFDDKLEFRKNFYDKNGYLYYVDKIELEFLKAKYIAIRGKNLDDELESIRSHIYIVALFAATLVMVLAYFLTKMFLQPIRNYISKIDDFIKDTTHELNTPLAAIMMTIETIDKTHLDPKLLRKIMRIDIAAKTISSLYQDLTFMALYGKSPNKNQNIDLVHLFEERIDYFAPLADVKSIVFVCDLEPSVIFADPNKMRILIDNLISNAIKYNSKNGHIRIILRQGAFSIEDEGIGIASDKLDDIFARYARFDETNGGFGLGLNIVKMICEEYGIGIGVASDLGKGAKFELTWNPRVAESLS